MVEERAVDALVQNIKELVQVIDDCLEHVRLLPCLSLLYTGIDVIASLERQAGEKVWESFTRWADRYMVQQTGLHVTALELYGARCGILHTFTAESNLHARGQVRQVYYAWGSARPEELQRAVDSLGKPATAVHVRDVVEAFRCGAAAYLDELASDVRRRQGIAPRIGLWFRHTQPGLVDAFNAASDTNGAT